MLDMATIQEMSRKAAARAAREGKVPFIVEAEDIEAFRRRPGFPFPFLGTYVPKGWKKIGEYFVDSSGFGSENEPALTARAFVDKLVPGRGYAVTEAGQFQVYVGEFVQRKARRKVAKGAP